MASGKPWTEEEKQYLRDNYFMDNKDLAERLGRSRVAIKQKASKMKIKKPKNQYEVYKGYELLASGTKEECAEKLGVSPFYIRWMTTPAVQKRLASENRTIAFKLDEDELEGMEHEQLEG